MANTLANPTGGFQAFGRMEGGSPTAGLTPVWIASTDAATMFRGDPCITTPGALVGTNNSGNYITSVQNSTYAAPGNNGIRGVFMGCEYYQPTVGRTVWSQYWPGTVTGSTGDIRAWIIDDPQQVFICQGSTTQAIGSSFVGLNIGFTANSSTGNTTSGLSNVALQSTTAGSTNTYPWRIVDFYSAYAPPGVPNVGTNAFVNGTDNTTAANILVVRMNNCDRLNATARSS